MISNIILHKIYVKYILLLLVKRPIKVPKNLKIELKANIGLEFQTNRKMQFSSKYKFIKIFVK